MTMKKKKLKNDARTKEFVHDRDVAVASFDVITFKAYMQKWFPDKAIPSDDVIEISMRKMACEITSMPIHIRTQAAAWLTQRGFKAGF